MESNCSRHAMKRKRSHSYSLDDEDFNGERSKAWDDPTILEEMGLCVLGSDASSSDEGELQDLLDYSSSEADENVVASQGGICQHKKKRRLNGFQREPLTEQTLVKNEANILHCEEDETKTIEKLKPTNCVIKNSQVSYGKDENGNRETTEESVCNNEFIISRLKKEDRISGKDYFAMLPDELIMSIFKCLDRRSLVNCCSVSKRLNRIAADESLWTKTDLSGRNLQKLMLGNMMRRGPFIVRLASASIPDPVCEPRQFPKNFTCKIQYLDLSMATISQDGLAKLLSYCTKLKKLSVEHCSIGDKAAARIAQNKGLEVLNMTMCSDVSTEGLRKILSKCLRLQSLNIAWTSLNRASVKVVAENIPLTIERLNISGCRRNITDDDVIAILDRCKNLIEFDISDASDITERSIEFIVHNVSGLEYLAISRCYSIPLSCLKQLNNVDSLTFLDLFGLFSDQELKLLATSLTKIHLNQFIFSSVARPTVGMRRTSIWGLGTRD